MGIMEYYEVGLIIVNLFECIMLLINYCNCNRGLLLNRGLVVIAACILGLTFIFCYLFFKLFIIDNKCRNHYL
jgi:hypothetical protein